MNNLVLLAGIIVTIVAILLVAFKQLFSKKPQLQQKQQKQQRQTKKTASTTTYNTNTIVTTAPAKLKKNKVSPKSQEQSPKLESQKKVATEKVEKKIEKTIKKVVEVEKKVKSNKTTINKKSQLKATSSATKATDKNTNNTNLSVSAALTLDGGEWQTVVAKKKQQQQQKKVKKPAAVDPLIQAVADAVDKQQKQVFKARTDKPSPKKLSTPKADSPKQEKVITETIQELDPETWLPTGITKQRALRE